MAVGNIIKNIQNIMREDAGVDGDAQRLGQLTWMLFLKIYDDKEREREAFEPNYKSPIPDDCRWRNWAGDNEGLTGDSLTDFVNNRLFPALKNLKLERNADPAGRIVRDVFADAYNYLKSGTILRRSINELNKIDFNRQEDRHLLNDIYETLLKSLQSAGNAGEYYTPRPVTKFITEIVDPKLGDRVLDPACGTGGFLVNAIEHMEQSVETDADRERMQANISGIEKKPLPHLLCITNLILHGVEAPENVKRGNTLTRPSRDYTDKDRVDVILTNPPFGGTEEAGVKSNFPQNFRTTETADLFVYLIVRLLKKGGRAGMVLPDSFLSGDGIKARLKELLMRECNLHTIVRLPPGVFNPYSAVRTSLLFFDKGSPTRSVWFYEMELPEGVKKQYTKGRPITHQEFEPIKEWWANRAPNDYAWQVDASHIEQNSFDLHLPNPSKKTAKVYDKDDLMRQAQSLSKEISDLVERLDQELKS